MMNVARYYHHETVHVGGSEDDVNENIRKRLNIMKASNAFRIASANKAESKIFPLNTPETSIGSLQKNRNGSLIRKRSFSSFNEPLPINKRICSSSPHKRGANLDKSNKMYCRVILRDYRKNIYKASSRVAILITLEGNITDKRRVHRLIVFKIDCNRI
jgi:hypothetical protein